LQMPGVGGRKHLLHHMGPVPTEFEAGQPHRDSVDEWNLAPPRLTSALSVPASS
jgi:hypothetical protein